MPSVDFIDGNVNLYVAEGSPTAPATLSVVTLFVVRQYIKQRSPSPWRFNLCFSCK